MNTDYYVKPKRNTYANFDLYDVYPEYCAPSLVGHWMPYDSDMRFDLHVRFIQIQIV